MTSIVSDKLVAGSWWAHSRQLVT